MLSFFGLRRLRRIASSRPRPPRLMVEQLDRRICLNVDMGGFCEEDWSDPESELTSESTSERKNRLVR